METKEQLIAAIKDWVKIENEIKTLQFELKSRRTALQKLSSILMETMKKEKLDGVDINNGKEHICYTKRTINKPITKKVLLDILSKYYAEDSNKAVEVNSFILDNREKLVKETISLKKSK